MNLTQLSLLLGKNVGSPDTLPLLQAFPTLKSSVLDIASDENVEVEHYLTSESEGIQVRHSSEGAIEVIFLMSEGKDGFSQYKPTLGAALSFSSCAPSVIQAMGQPTQAKPARTIALLGTVGETMRYDYPTHSIHFQFRASGNGIELITLSVKSSTPGRNG